MAAIASSGSTSTLRCWPHKSLTVIPADAVALGCGRGEEVVLLRLGLEPSSCDSRAAKSERSKVSLLVVLKITSFRCALFFRERFTYGSRISSIIDAVSPSWVEKQGIGLFFF